MYKLFIDTNKFLDFYRSKEENNEILGLLSDCQNIIITEQVIDEFNRNRKSVLSNLKKMIDDTIKELNNNSYSVNPIGFLNKEIKNINEKNKELILNIKDNLVPLRDKINEMINNPSNDEVFQTFDKIIHNENTIILKHNDKYYEKAKKRNELGGIPRSDKNASRHLTVCDEYIWETIIGEAKDDIIFVTGDNTYIDNKNILIDEYNEMTTHNIIFSSLISDGLEKLGEKLSINAKESEQKTQNLIENVERLENSVGADYTSIMNELKKYPQMEQEVIEFRFGLKDGNCYTLKEVGDFLGHSREEIRQIEAKALHKLRYNCPKV